MSNYRLYTMRNLGGHYEGYEHIDAGNDAEAIRLTEPYQKTHCFELWDRGRKVYSFRISAIMEDHG